MTSAQPVRESGIAIRSLRIFAIIAFVAGVSVFAGSLGWYFLGGDSPPADRPFVEIPLATATPAPPTSTVRPSPTPAPPPYDGAIARFLIPRFGVDAAIENIGIVDTPAGRQLDTPHDPYNVGWYGLEEISEKPGFGGNAVFAAHVDYYPNIRGPFWQLDELEGNDEVVIVMDDGREYRYSVVAKRSYDKDEIPMGELIDGTAPDLVQPPGAEWVTLITCGGQLVRYYEGGPGYYVDRVVVIAQLISQNGPGAADSA